MERFTVRYNTGGEGKWDLPLGTFECSEEDIPLIGEITQELYDPKNRIHFDEFIRSGKPREWIGLREDGKRYSVRINNPALRLLEARLSALQKNRKITITRRVKDETTQEG